MCDKNKERDILFLCPILERECFIIISLPKTKKGVFKKSLYYRRFYGFMYLTFSF